MQIYKKNWRNKSVQLFMFVFIILGFSFGLGGCYKKQDTTLQVYVLDNTGSVVKDANVNVYAEPTDTSIHNPVSLNFSKITNENGVALFNLNEQYESGQSGVAIVKIKATYYNKSGESVVQIIEEVTNQCSIQIQ
jgi:hypothetical protein